MKTKAAPEYDSGGSDIHSTAEFKTAFDKAQAQCPVYIDLLLTTNCPTLYGYGTGRFCGSYEALDIHQQ